MKLTDLGKRPSTKEELRKYLDDMISLYPTPPLLRPLRERRPELFEQPNKES